MTDEDPVIVRLNVSHYRHLLQVHRLTESERRTVASLVAECEAQLAAALPESTSPLPTVT
jgi:hypothetical protein